jgi:hypothetical protein
MFAMRRHWAIGEGLLITVGLFLNEAEAGASHGYHRRHLEINEIAIANDGFVGGLKDFQASSLSGPLLARMITASRNEAIEGALPIPPDIRRQLTGYASEDSMNRVRYRIVSKHSLNLASLLERGGFADAVTLIDVIVFKSPVIVGSACAWAHELTHVDQFHEWGVNGFAVRYARDWKTVESRAYAKGDGYDQWKHQQNERLRSDVTTKCSVK